MHRSLRDKSGAVEGNSAKPPVAGPVTANGVSLDEEYMRRTRGYRSREFKFSEGLEYRECAR
jgi:hypothetical protein